MVDQICATDPNAKVLCEFYDHWAKDYDGDLLEDKCAYENYDLVAKEVLAHVKDKAARILDACVGTGLGRKVLKAAG